MTPPPCPPTPCREWRGSTTPNGYGRKSFNGKQRRIHRWVYSRLNGGFRGIYGKQVLHLCDNKLCYRYDHLWCGTHTDNMDDRNTKGRQARGERHGSAKLTEEQVGEIRQRCQAGETTRSLAKEFGVSQATIAQTASHRIWKEVART